MFFPKRQSGNLIKIVKYRPHPREEKEEALEDAQSYTKEYFPLYSDSLIDILSFTPSEKVFDSHVFVMDKVTGIFLRKEVKELREKGASWGLSKEQIDEAILRALGGKRINFKSFLFFFILMKAECIHILSIF